MRLKTLFCRTHVDTGAVIGIEGLSSEPVWSHVGRCHGWWKTAALGGCGRQCIMEEKKRKKKKKKLRLEHDTELCHLYKVAHLNMRVPSV